MVLFFLKRFCYFLVYNVKLSGIVRTATFELLGKLSKWTQGLKRVISEQHNASRRSQTTLVSAFAKYIIILKLLVPLSNPASVCQLTTRGEKTELPFHPIGYYAQNGFSPA